MDSWYIETCGAEDQTLAGHLARVSGANQDGMVLVGDNSKFIKDGQISHFNVYRNLVIYAIVPDPIQAHVYQGDPTGKLTVVIEEKHMVQRVVPDAPVCTCGGWAVYGKEANIHSDDRVNVCDLRKVQ